jgi:hypothetical protein
MKRALVIIALLLPAPASAATTSTVGPGGSIAAALAAAGDGDTIHVLPGTYAEPPLTVAHAVRIEGEPGTTVTTASSDPLFKVTHDGVTLTGMTATNAAGGVVLSQAKDLVLDALVLTRTAGSDASVVMVDSTPTSGTTTISRSLVVNATGGTGHTSPAVAGGPSNSFAIADSLIVSGAGEGPALRFAGGSANTLVRSSVAAIEPGSDAVQAQSTTTGAKHLAIDSAVLSGGASAVSLRATTENSLLVLNTGDLGITAVHATIAGAAAAVTTQATSIGIGSPGAIAVSADRSILRGTVAGSVSVTSSDTSTADVFVSAAAKNFHLRADAPVIDQGGPAGDGESDRDVDGQPRVAGAASDLGADEFVNRAPTARLATPATVRTPAAVAFDASSSADPEAGAGGGIASFHFDFGDGTSADAPSPGVAHAYARPGTYAARITVTDAQGLAGAPSDPVQVQVLDGIAPTVQIISPRAGKKLRRRGPIRFTGSAADETGVAAVRLTLRRIGTKKATNLSTRLAQGIWTKRLPSRPRLKRGRYELTAIAVDTAGNVSTTARVRFRLK